MEGVEQEAGAARPGAHDAPDAVAAHDTIDTAEAHAAKAAATAGCAGFLLDTLHLPLRSCLAFRDGLSS